jgi:DNA-binding beta-propeller fold protein YncE
VININGGTVLNHLYLDEMNKLLWVSDTGGFISAIDTGSNTVVRGPFATGGRPQEIVVDVTNKVLFIADENDGLEVWNLLSQTKVMTVDAGSVSTSGFGLDRTRDNKQLWMTDYFQGTVTVYDATTYAPLQVIKGMTHPRRIRFNANGDTALVTDEDSVNGKVWVIR